MNEILDPEVWQRAGRGRHRDVPSLTPKSVGSWIRAFPPEYRPYRLIAFTLEGSGNNYRPQSHLIDPERIGESVAVEIWQYFVVSELLSPELLQSLPEADIRLLSVNGALNLQIGSRDRKGYLEPASIGIVDKVGKGDGEKRDHVEYRSIFDAAVRAANRLAGGDAAST